MLLDNITKAVNEKLAGELFPFDSLIPYLDEVVDDINIKLNANFPVFSDFTYANFPQDYPNYTFFPDKYIRTVVVIGAAYKFYRDDEEGSTTAEIYSYNYQDNLFFMQRDYSDQVPEEYQADYTGSVPMDDKVSGSDSCVQDWGGFF